MPKPSFGLGRGLNALIPSFAPRPKAASSNIPDTHEDASSASAAVVEHVPLSSIHPNPQQPRKDFPGEQIEELASSIRKYGLLQPLIVTQRAGGGYELVVGERRVRAAKLVPLKEVPVIVRTAGELEKLELALIENIQRSDLNPIERANAYQRLVDEFSLTQEEAAKRLSISRPQLANTLRFLALPIQVQQALAQGVLSEGHAKIIASLPSEQEQLRAFEQIQRDTLTVRETEALVRRAPEARATGATGIGAVPAYAQEFIDRLRKLFGTKVSLHQRAHGGSITIDYYSSEELQEMLKALERLTPDQE